jgi:glyoxylase-like metal-dependent hydrolase (beta-lactamase superfamily II)
MDGTVSVTDRGSVKVHTYTAPEQGYLVTTHLVELPSQLIAVDAQYGLPYAREAVEYATGLGKPIARLYISHEHPDHYLGAGAFPAPGYALPQIKRLIEERGDAQAAQIHAAFGDFVAATATKPEHAVRPGEETIDGVRFELRAVEGVESALLLTIGLPDQGVLIVQDLVYNNVHLFVADGRFESWAAAIDEYRRLPYDTVLPGHGEPGGTELYDRVLEYLVAARPVVEQSSTGEELKARLVERFPDYRGVAILDIQNMYMFPAGA